MQPQVPLLATPNPHPHYGLNDDWANHLLMNGPLHALKILNLLDGTHSDVIRMNMLWSVVEKKQGTYDWSAFDQLNATFKAHGLKPLWVILAAPCWAQPNPGGCSAGNDKLRPAPAYYDELARFAAAAAVRYRDAVGFEVWNEPNYPRFWGGEMPDPADYSNMFKQVADAIHAAAPGTRGRHRRPLAARRQRQERGRVLQLRHRAVRERRRAEGGRDRHPSLRRRRAGRGLHRRRPRLPREDPGRDAGRRRHDDADVGDRVRDLDDRAACLPRRGARPRRSPTSTR